jgi:hypothetical protein
MVLSSGDGVTLADIALQQRRPTMDHNPDITNVMTRDRIAALYATASNSRVRRGVAVSTWRKLAGAALVRLGQSILGDPRPAPLAVASPSR